MLIVTTPQGDKESRVAGVSSILEEGRVLLPTGAPWLSEFVKELTGFPSTKHDDQVDSLTQFLAYVRTRRIFPRLDPTTGRAKTQRVRLRATASGVHDRISDH